MNEEKPVNNEEDDKVEELDEISPSSELIEDDEDDDAEIKIEGPEIEFEKVLIEEEEEVPEEKKKSIYQQILTMGISGKIQLALKGNKEARGILVKDPNKLVCSAVVKSPKVNDAEALTYAKSRTVSDEVLRLISRNKTWMRSHQMALALVNNPRTPIPISLKLMAGLSDKEFADLAKAKGIPGVIVSTARRTIQAKLHKQEKKDKKH